MKPFESSENVSAFTYTVNTLDFTAHLKLLCYINVPGQAGEGLSGRLYEAPFRQACMGPCSGRPL